MRIAELADRSGVLPRTVRFYADQGLLPTDKRSSAGYRDFGDAALRRLRFIRRAQALGMSLDEVGRLLRAIERQSCGQASRMVTGRLTEQLGAVERRIADLQAVAHELRSVLSAQKGGCTDELCLCNAGPNEARASSATADRPAR